MYPYNYPWSGNANRINPVASDIMLARNAYNAHYQAIFANMPPVAVENAPIGLGLDLAVAGAGPEIPMNKVRVLRGRESEVFMCSWNPYMDLLASGSNNSTARIWDVSDNEILVPNPIVLRHSPHRTGMLPSTDRDITALEWSYDGSLLATGSFEGYGHIWTVNGTLSTALGKHAGPIFAMKWNKRGDYILSAGADKKAVVWDRSTGFCIQQFAFHSAPVIDVDWKTDSCFASCSTDNRIFICELNSNQPIRTFLGHQDEVNAVKWNPQGELLASCSDDATLKIWNMHQDTPLSDLRVHNKEIYTIKWSPTGPGTQFPNMMSILASGSFDSTIRLWDVERGLTLHALTKHSEPVYCIDFSPNGQFLVSGSLDNWICVWSTNNGELVRYFKAPDSIYEVCWNSSGTKIGATSSNGSVIVIDLRSN